MQCVILAGGRATRLGPLGADRPKHLVPVAGRPFADLQLAWLTASGVDDVLYCIGHLGGQIVDHVGDGSLFGLRVDYCDEGPALRGTGGALRLALERGQLDERFLVLYGDSFLRVDLDDLWTSAATDDTSSTMAVFRNDDGPGVSNVCFEHGRVVRYDKSVDDPAAEGLRHIDYGVSVFSRRSIRLIAPDTVADLAQLQAALSSAGQLGGHEVHERFYEVGTAHGIAELENYLATAEECRP